MSTSRNTPSLNEEQLRSLLSGKADGSLKKLLDDCELSKEALAGFAAVPVAMDDLLSLKKHIAKRSGMNGMTNAMKWFFATGVVAVVFVSAYFLLKEHSSVPAKTNVSAEQPATVSDVQGNLPPLYVHQEEHFVNPEAVKRSVTVAKKDSVKTPGITPQPIDNNDEDVPQLLDQKPVIPAHPEAGYNASIGFVFDLKVTDFEKYYRRSIEVHELPLTGVPAEYADDHASKDNSMKETVREVPAEKFLDDALLAFHNGHYGKCIEKMEVLQKNDKEDVNALFYMGVSYVKLEMYAKAIPLLDAVLNSQNNVFHEEAKWYKAQALSGSGQNEQAKVLLNEIAAADGFYKAKAEEMLRRME